MSPNRSRQWPIAPNGSEPYSRIEPVSRSPRGPPSPGRRGYPTAGFGAGSTSGGRTGSRDGLSVITVPDWRVGAGRSDASGLRGPATIAPAPRIVAQVPVPSRSLVTQRSETRRRRRRADPVGCDPRAACWTYTPSRALGRPAVRPCCRLRCPPSTGCSLARSRGPQARRGSAGPSVAPVGARQPPPGLGAQALGRQPMCQLRVEPTGERRSKPVQTSDRGPWDRNGG